MSHRIAPLIALLLLLLSARASATGELNVLTDLLSPFPPGCVALSLPQQPASADNLLFQEDVWVPGIGSNVRDARVRVTIWRVGCHDPGFSVVMVRLQQLSGPNPVAVPMVFAEAGVVDEPFHLAQLIEHPAVGNVGATGNIISTQGQTWMLAVDPIAIDGQTTFFPEDYNELFTLELYWDAAGATPFGQVFDILPYEPDLDPTQFEFPIMHGRMSGQYIFEGIPSTGLQLAINERADDTNFAFATLYTYLNGQPFWLVGNTQAETPGSDLLVIDMLRVTGGQFFGLGPGQTRPQDIQAEVVGQMVIEALDCDNLLIGYDFSPIGLGNGVTIGNRGESNVAGYACNPW